MLAHLFLIAQPPLVPGLGGNMTAQEFFVTMSLIFLVAFVAALVSKMFNVRVLDRDPEDIRWELWLLPVLSLACWFVYYSWD